MAFPKNPKDGQVHNTPARIFTWDQINIAKATLDALSLVVLKIKLVQA